MEPTHPDSNKTHTYADYLSWEDDKRRELINGFIKSCAFSEAETQRYSTHK